MLMWERLKHTERFNFLEKNKVLHIVADDQINENWKENEWYILYFVLHVGIQIKQFWTLNCSVLKTL